MSLSQLPAHQEARQLLQEELARRCTKNPRYSLRSFAKALGLSHTVLSLVMTGKRPLSKKAVEQVAQALGLHPTLKERLLHDRLSRGGPVPQALIKTREFQQLRLDAFALISDWASYALLSLLDLEDAQWDGRWIAKRLRIHEAQAKTLMERLLRMGLVAPDAQGRIRQTGKPIKVENTISTGVTRAFHRQLLEKALESLENDPIECRDFSSMTMAIDPEHVPWARERIREFRRSLSQELESKGAAKRVYNLTVQLYPVSTEEKKT